MNQKNRTLDNGSLYYDYGFMKAAYGSFLEGLLVIYCNDLVADCAAERFNVSWERTSPMVMSVRDDNVRTVMSGESSFYFGRTAYGDLDAVRAFYFACSASFSSFEQYVGTALFPRIGDNSNVTTGLGFILDNGGSIEIIQDGNFTLIREAGSNERILVFDSNTGLLHDQMLEFYGAFCYSNQQTDWAYDLGRELLDNFDSIWGYLFGDGDFPDLSLSAGNLIKSANLFVGLGGMFVVEGAELTGTLTDLGALVGGLGMGSLASACLFTLPVLFASIAPVGEDDGFVDDYWDYHTYSQDDPYVVPSDDLVQIKNNKNSDYDKILRPYDRAEGYGPGISNAFVLANSGPDGDNGSKIIKFASVSLIIMLIHPYSLFSVSQIYNYVVKYSYENETKECTIELSDYKLKE